MSSKSDETQVTSDLLDIRNEPCHNQSARAFILPASSETPTLPPTVIFLSPRAWLAQWPRRLQICIVALLLLASVAQSWHVCAMGGHAMGASAHSSHGGANVEHGPKEYKILTNADGTPGPIICECAHDDLPQGQTIGARPDAHSHVTCLALLLQTMPVQTGVPFTLNQREDARPLYATRTHFTPAFATPLAERGRAPPLDC